MAINKVVYGNNTLLDLTEDTVTENNVLEGETFHDASGQRRTGSLVIPVQDVEVNGESVVNSEKVAEIDIPTTDIQTAVDEFETYNGGILSSLKVALSPNQDLHGYDSPWVGGAGKNKLPLRNKSGSGLTFVANELLGKMTMTGTATTGGWGPGIMIEINLPAGSYICSATNNPNNANIMTEWQPLGAITSSGITFNVTSNTQPVRVAWRIDNGTTYNNVIEGLMIRSASDTDPTFEPYSNICPISGHTQVDVDVSDGVNKINPDNMGHYGRDNATGQIDRTETYMSSTTNPVKVDPSTTYTIARNGTKYVLRVYYYGVDKSYIGNEVVDGTFTIPNNAYYIAWQSGNASGALDLWSMVEGSSSAYIPYNGYQITVNLGGTYYSGTLDVVTGVFIPDTAKYVLTDISVLELYTTDTSTGSYAKIKTTEYPSIKEDVSSELASSCKAVAFADRVVDVHDNRFFINTNYVLIRASIDENVTTVNELFAIFENCEFILPLATPTPIQLSPTMVKALVGENHLSAPLEGQEIDEVKYKEAFDFNDVIKVANYFTLPLQTFTFTNKICNVNDSRVTSNSLVDVYFTSDSMSSVEDAGITVESQNGKIVMTAEEQPVGTIQGRIKVVN